MTDLHRCVVSLKSEYGHQDIVIYYRDLTAPMAGWLQNYFASTVAEGTTFRAGETVQIGWMLLTLHEDEGGQLAVWEPGFHTMPIE